MNAEETLVAAMANLAAAWDAEAAHVERGNPGMNTAEIYARQNAAVLRQCAIELRSRLDMHRHGPAWSAG